MGLDHLTLPNWCPEMSLNNTNSCGNLNKSHACRVQLFGTPWTVACWAPLSVKISRQEYWSKLPCPPPGDLPHPRTEPVFCVSCISSRLFTTEPPGKPLKKWDWAAHQLWWSSVKGLREGQRQAVRATQGKMPDKLREQLKTWKEGHVSGT